jgi:hypothetical protein
MRPWLLIALALIAGLLAYMARDLVQNVIVLPLAYLLWQLQGLMAGVAQLVQWVVLLALIALVLAWQLVPRLAPRNDRAPAAPIREGQVNATAVCLFRARKSNYFRWQLAHRLGRAAGQLGGLPAQSLPAGHAPDRMARYLDAGLNHSFVDYAAPRLSIRRHVDGPLELDPQEVVRFLEVNLPGGGVHAQDR